jgi:hypothetical protein
MQQCQMLGWHNFSLKMEEKAACIYQDCYPIKIKGMVLVNSPWIVNAMVRLVKVFLKKKLSDRIINVNQQDLITTESIGNLTFFILFNY